MILNHEKATAPPQVALSDRQIFGVISVYVFQDFKDLLMVVSFHQPCTERLEVGDSLKVICIMPAHFKNTNSVTFPAN